MCGSRARPKWPVCSAASWARQLALETIKAGSRQQAADSRQQADSGQQAAVVVIVVVVVVVVVVVREERSEKREERRREERRKKKDGLALEFYLGPYVLAPAFVVYPCFRGLP